MSNDNSGSRGGAMVRALASNQCARCHTLFFFIRTSNFDAEAERSYIFWRFEAETFLKMFLKMFY